MKLDRSRDHEIGEVGKIRLIMVDERRHEIASVPARLAHHDPSASGSSMVAFD